MKMTRKDQGSPKQLHFQYAVSNYQALLLIYYILLDVRLLTFVLP